MSLSEIKFSGRYKLEHILCKTYSKTIFRGRNVQTGELVVIKAEFFKAKNANILYEGKFLQMTQGCPGIPWMHWCGPESEECNCLIVEYLGWPLNDLLKECGGTFSLKTVLMIGLQLLEILEVYHFKELVHRRVCVHSLQMGKGKKNHLVFFNDLLNSRKYIDTKSGQHIPNKETPGPPMGSTIFTSRKVLESEEASRRDDIESLLLVLIYLFNGSLPWSQGFPNINEISAGVVEILTIRKNLTNEQLCRGMPREFLKLMDYVRQLEHSQQPNYTFIRRQFRRVLKKNNLQEDYVFDWVKKGLVGEHQVEGLNIHESPVFTDIINNEAGFVEMFYKPLEGAIDASDTDSKPRRTNSLSQPQEREPHREVEAMRNIPPLKRRESEKCLLC